MTNIINITEKNNRLEFSDSYTPIVCGNSNYLLKFSFGDQWQSCNKKAAIFVVEGNKLTVDFDGDECKVPVMPNASFVQVSLVSGDGDIELATTALKIRLEPTIAGGDFSEFNQLTNYLPKVLGAINKIENGEIVAKNAEYANVATIAENVSNLNLLINGDFRINQRGQNTYSGNSIYSVDRWNLYYGALAVNNNGTITHTATSNWQGIRQFIENPSRLAGKTVTFSMKASSTGTKLAQLNIIKSGESSSTILGSTESTDSGEDILSFSVTIPEDITDSDKLFVLLYTPQANQSVTYYWAKLEIGNTPTEFVPRLYAEELALCQRFYQRINSTAVSAKLVGMGLSNGSLGFFPFILNIPLRATPTISYNNLSIYNGVAGGNISINNIVLGLVSTNPVNNFNLQVYFSGEVSKCYMLRIEQGVDNYIGFDAEIY